MSTKDNIILAPSEQLEIIKLPTILRGTYITWRMGFDPYFLMSRETFYRHAKELKKHGYEIRKKWCREDVE